jgi:hypothetical protein
MKVVLVGPLPEPIGGVSSHVERLAAALAKSGIECTVIDTYPSRNKIKVEGVTHELAGRGGHISAMFGLWLKLFQVEGNVVHLHFSQLVGRFLPVALLLIRSDCKLVLTLHHGDQEKVHRNASWLVRIVARRALRRMDAIVALSEQQRTFYRSLGISVDRILPWPFTVPSSLAPVDAVSLVKLAGIKAIEHGGNESILVTSGYPHRSYNYELCLKLLDVLSPQVPCRLIVCLYGTSHDSAYETDLRTRLAVHPRVIVLGPMPAGEFLAVLARASIYLRPSSIDSFGLAVTDALNVGTPCLASDICERDKRCETYPVNEESAFLRQAIALIEQGRKLRRKPNIGKLDSISTERVASFYRDLPPTGRTNH